MKIDDNGTVRDMTADEIRAFEEMLKKDDLISVDNSVNESK